MAANEIKQISVNIGALSNASRPIFKVPSGYGGITVLGGNIIGSAAGTTALNLVNLGSAGTSIGGTIATKGSAVYVANIPQAMTVVAASAFVDEGEWVGVNEANVGAAAAECIVTIYYLDGK